jgi:hypothetical protein
VGADGGVALSLGSPGRQELAQGSQRLAELTSLAFDESPHMRTGHLTGSPDRDDLPDLGEGQAEAPRPGDERQQGQRVGAIEPVPAVSPLRRCEDPGGLVEPEGLSTEPALDRHLANQQALASHGPTLHLAPKWKVNGLFTAGHDRANGLRLTLGHAAEASAVWSYPVLCLAWRLGWGGRRLGDRDAPEALGATFRALTRAIDRPAPGVLDPSAHRELAGTMPAPHANAKDDSDASESASTVLDRLTTLLHRSPLAALIAVPERAAAVRDTAWLIRPELPGRHTVPVPPFWRQAFAAGRDRCDLRWVPRPRPRWDPATWTLVGVLEAAWEATGTTFLGRERPALFPVAGTRRMAARYGWSLRRTLACGRTAHRIWRHWFERTERIRLDRVRAWPASRRVAATLGDPILAYRLVRGAVRTGRRPPDLEAVPATLRGLLWSLARTSVMDFRLPVVADRPPELRVAVARALLMTPLGVGAARSGAEPHALWSAANETAARVLWLLTAPWPWTPRPVVRGPRRARQEARRRYATLIGRWRSP